MSKRGLVHRPPEGARKPSNLRMDQDWTKDQASLLWKTWLLLCALAAPAIPDDRAKVWSRIAGRGSRVRAPLDPWKGRGRSERVRATPPPRRPRWGRPLPAPPPWATGGCGRGGRGRHGAPARCSRRGQLHPAVLAHPSAFGALWLEKRRRRDGGGGGGAGQEARGSRARDSPVAQRGGMWLRWSRLRASSFSAPSGGRAAPRRPGRADHGPGGAVVPDGVASSPWADRGR